MSVSEVVGLCVGVLTVVALLLAALGWFVKAKIREFTYQIQPESNGGRSLPDLHNKVDGIRTDVDLLKSAVLQLEDDVEGLM